MLVFVAAAVFALLLLAAYAFPFSTPAAADSTVAVDIAGYAFMPADLTVVTGTTMTWTNQDSFPHTVTSDAGGWDSGILFQGQSYAVTFATPGTYPIYCAFHHSFMQRTITVTG